MRAIVIISFCLLHLTNAAPQFVSFKDGKIGVNFGGYHAEAGLGGLLTGNAAHGGLSASAGTPWGPQAAAGLGGDLNGRASGIAYAGAQANPSVGASAVLGGTAGHSGFAGSEAHADGKVALSMHSSDTVQKPIAPPTSAPVANEPSETNYIQKIKPHKKYTLIRDDATNDNGNAVHAKKVVKTVQKHTYSSGPLPVQGTFEAEGNAQASPGVVFSALNIPIGILRSLQESLGGVLPAHEHAQLNANAQLH